MHNGLWTVAYGLGQYFAYCWGPGRVYSTENSCAAETAPPPELWWRPCGTTVLLRSVLGAYKPQIHLHSPTDNKTIERFFYERALEAQSIPACLVFGCVSAFGLVGACEVVALSPFLPPSLSPSLSLWLCLLFLCLLPFCPAFRFLATCLKQFVSSTFTCFGVCSLPVSFFPSVFILVCRCSLFCGCRSLFLWFFVSVALSCLVSVVMSCSSFLWCVCLSAPSFWLSGFVCGFPHVLRTCFISVAPSLMMSFCAVSLAFLVFVRRLALIIPNYFLCFPTAPCLFSFSVSFLWHSNVYRAEQRLYLDACPQLLSRCTSTSGISAHYRGFGFGLAVSAVLCCLLPIATRMGPSVKRWGFCLDDSSTAAFGVTPRPLPAVSVAMFSSYSQSGVPKPVPGKFLTASRFVSHSATRHPLWFEEC